VYFRLTFPSSLACLRTNNLQLPIDQASKSLLTNGISYFRTGLYKTPFPYRMGRESSGTILSLGPGSPSQYYGLKVGDRVVSLSNETYSQYSAVPALTTVKMPDEISFENGCAALLQGLTALTMIRESYEVKQGDWILVHAAAGGVGLWLCQLLKAVGAGTIATASTTEKLELAKQYGAEILINYAEDDVHAKVMEVTGGKGVPAVFDGVGKSTFELSLSCLARRGMFVSFGNASGPVPPFSIARLGDKNLKICRPRMGSYLETREEIDGYITELFKFMTDHKLDVRIHEIYPLSESARAQSVSLFFMPFRWQCLIDLT
jgi:NADPH:quinone reductase